MKRGLFLAQITCSMGIGKAPRFKLVSLKEHQIWENQFHELNTYNPTSPLGAVDGSPGPLGVVPVHALEDGSKGLPVDEAVGLGESVAESADLLVGLAEDVRCEGVHDGASWGGDL